MRGKADKRRGQILIMATLVSIPLFGMLGLVTDLGYMHYVKMTADSAAEVAAQAAMIDFHHTMGGASYGCGGNVVCASTETACSPNITSPQNSIEHGCMYAQAHGFNYTGGVTYQTGTASAPPTASGFGNAPYWVTFRTYKKVPQLFSAVLGNLNGLVVGRSTGAVVGSQDCIYALDPTMQSAISVGGTAALTSSCGVFDNSNNGCALSTNGGGTVTAPEYDIVGNACTQIPLSPAANVGVAPASDPLASLPAPASAPYKCDYNNFTAKNTNATASPGVYCGGISVDTNASLSLSSGVYVLVGGGITTQSTNSSISGAGVEFYNTFDNNNSYQPININANSSVSLTAPTTGTDAGMLFFDDRNAPSGSSCGNNGKSSCADNYGGGSTAVYQGIIYNKNNCVTMYGNSSVNTQYTMVVADCINLVGTTAFNNNYSSLPNGQSPLQQVMVVE